MLLNPIYVYPQAVEVVKKLKIETKEDYFKACERDKKLPLNPDKCYVSKFGSKYGWNGWNSFLGKEIKSKAEKAERRLKRFRGMPKRKVMLKNL